MERKTNQLNRFNIQKEKEPEKEEEQEEIKEEEKPKQSKIITKSKLIKKTIINPNQTKEITSEVKNTSDSISFNHKEKLKSNQKENNAEFLLKTILKAYYVSVWKKKVKSMKYYSRSYNPRRINFKKLITEISSAIKQHKFEFFNEIYENMNNLPMPSHIKHDVNYGTIRIVDKEFVNKNDTNKNITINKNTDININKNEQNKKNEKIEINTNKYKENIVKEKNNKENTNTNANFNNKNNVKPNTTYNF